jgi:hypothetical protein
MGDAYRGAELTGTYQIRLPLKRVISGDGVGDVYAQARVEYANANGWGYAVYNDVAHIWSTLTLIEVPT